MDTYREDLLTKGETIAEALSHYLDCFDPMRREPDPSDETSDGSTSGLTSGSTSGPDTSHDPARRRLAASIKRLVRRRANDRCEVAGCCKDIFLEFAHIIPHSRGGTRTVRNIVLLCTQHHFMLDAHLLRFVGWSAGRRGSDAPVFDVMLGEECGERFGGDVLEHAPPAGSDPPPNGASLS